MKKIAILATLLMMASQALATVDNVAMTIVPRLYDLQDGPFYYQPYISSTPGALKKFCLHKGVIWEGFGVPSSNNFRRAAFKQIQNPYNVPAWGIPVPVRNINVLHHNIKIHPFQTSVTNAGVDELKVEIDVSALPRNNYAERVETITQAKLALLAVLELARKPYRAEVEILGLPNQNGLTNVSRVFAATGWPYTASSSLVAQYKQELISSRCP